MGTLNKLKVLTLKEEGEMRFEEGRGRTFKRDSTLHVTISSNPGGVVSEIYGTFRVKRSMPC